MPSLSELSVLYGIPVHRLRKLSEVGLEFYENDFVVDRHHQKALNELSRKRLTPYVIAYAIHWRTNHGLENHNRYEDIIGIADIRDLPIRATLIDIQSRKVYADNFPTAKFWIDRASGELRNADALERLARWIKMLIAEGPDWELSYIYFAVRLLLSIPYDEMPDYSRPIQRAFSRIKFHGHLDGWYRDEVGDDGKNRPVFFRAKYDL